MRMPGFRTSTSNQGSFSRSGRRTLAAFAALALGLGTALVGLTVPAAQADASPFVVSMTPSSSTVASGDLLTYTIDVGNSGGDITQDTQLVSQINGLTGLVLTSNVGTCSQTNNQVTCTAGTMPGFSGWRVTIRGTVTAPNGTTLFNGVTVTGNHESSGYSTAVNSSVFVSNTTTVPKADLRVSIQGPSTIADSTNVTYQLTVNNSGSVNAVDVRVVNNLPAGMSVASASGNSLFACSSVGLTTTCVGGRVNAGSNATITIVAASGGQIAGAQLKDTAVVDPYDQIDEINELNNTDSLVSVSAADPVQTGLQITKTDAPDPLRPGDRLTYTITVKNLDTKNRADNVAITDVTQGLDASSITATTTKGACTVSAPKVVCTQASPTLRLASNETMTVTITGFVTSQAGTLITNTATVTGVIKNKAVTNSAQTTTSVRPGVDLSVVMAAATNHLDGDDTPTSTDPFRAFDHFQYDIAVGNSGLDDASNVLVRLVVAPDVKLLGDTLGNTCGQAGTVITCTLPSLLGSVSSGQDWGTVQNFSVFVVSPPHPGTIQATVTVDPNNAIFEPDETNNVWSVSTPIVTGIDLTVSKSADDPIAPSGTLAYTINVDNIGTEDASGVTFKDFLPAGTRFRSVDDVSNHNFTCSHDGSATGGVVECHGGRINGTHDHTTPNPPPYGDRAVIKLVVFAPAAPGFYTNQVRVDPANEIPELLENNNINSWTTEVKIDGGLHAFHEFTIDKTQASPAGAVVPSGIVEYDLTVTNHGSDVAFDVTVQDIMPVGTTFRFAKDTLPGTGDFQCAETGGIITCTGGTLDGSIGQTAQAGDTTRTIHVSLFAPSQPGNYTNKAVVDPDNTHPEADETNNSDEVVTTVALSGGGKYIDFSIDSKQTQPGADGTDVVPSGALQYTVDVTNTGSAVAFGVQVSDVLPTGSVFRSAQDSSPGPGAFQCSQAGGVVTCTGGTLDGQNGPDETSSGFTRSIVIDVFAPTEPDTYFNTATVDPNHNIPEADETNNTDTTSTKVRIAGGGNFRDLVVQSITTSDTEPEPGQEYTYDVTVANTGTNPAYNVTLRNVLDEGATFVRYSTATAVDPDPNDFTCAISGNTLTCDGGVLDGSADLDPHDTTAVIRITVRAPQRHDYGYGLTSRVDPDNTVPESNEANNSKSLDVVVKSLVDLQTSVSSTGSQGGAGSVEFHAKNTGTSPATNVTLVVNMPVGVIPQNMGTVPAGWTCQIEENPINKVTCHGDLAGGDDLTFTVTTFVTAQPPITANAFIDPGNTIVESDETNNAANG
jgi:uncharacterized repeat protein (TIGR01451 family)